MQDYRYNPTALYCNNNRKDPLTKPKIEIESTSTFFK